MNFDAFLDSEEFAAVAEKFRQEAIAIKGSEPNIDVLLRFKIMAEYHLERESAERRFAKEDDMVKGKYLLNFSQLNLTWLNSATDKFVADFKLETNKQQPLYHHLYSYLERCSEVWLDWELKRNGVPQRIEWFLDSQLPAALYSAAEEGADIAFSKDPETMAKPLPVLKMHLENSEVIEILGRKDPISSKRVTKQHWARSKITRIDSDKLQDALLDLYIVWSEKNAQHIDLMQATIDSLLPTDRDLTTQEMAALRRDVERAFIAEASTLHREDPKKLELASSAAFDFAGSVEAICATNGAIALQSLDKQMQAFRERFSQKLPPNH